MVGGHRTGHEDETWGEEGRQGQRGSRGQGACLGNSGVHGSPLWGSRQAKVPSDRYSDQCV